MSATKTHDLHLSALKISKEAIKSVEKLGFVRDEFANSKYCLPNDYHATYRGECPLPDDMLWADTQHILQSDPDFVGNLEEEEHSRLAFTEASTNSEPIQLTPFEMTDVPPGQHKACDIHVAVQLDQVAESTLTQIEQLRMVSFDRPTTQGIRRVFSLTCESVEDGNAVFSVLEAMFGSLGATVRLKMENTTRFLRIPDNASGLPIVTSAVVRKWLESVQTPRPA